MRLAVALSMDTVPQSHNDGGQACESKCNDDREPVMVRRARHRGQVYTIGFRDLSSALGGSDVENVLKGTRNRQREKGARPCMQLGSKRRL
jgi:hypothetical protein